MEEHSDHWMPGEMLPRTGTSKFINGYYSVGRVMYVITLPPSWASDELVALLSLRATATVSQHCPVCLATSHNDEPVKVHDSVNVPVLELNLWHEAGCPVSDESMKQVVTSLWAMQN